MPAIPPHSTPTTSSPWDGPSAEAHLKPNQGAAYYKREFAWYDADGDDTKKSTYKFPHHMVSGDGDVGDANTEACSAIIGALNGGRGGAKIPEADRAGVHAHAAKHLKDAGKDAPELKSEREYVEALTEYNALHPEIERRYMSAESLELREDGDQPPVLTGYASVFDEVADLGYFKERVDAGAFNRAVNEDDVRALWNHNADYPLGRNRAKPTPTLVLRPDERGLYSRIMIPDTQMGKDVRTSIKRGDVSQMSFAFQVRSQKIDRDDAGNITRTLTDVTLYDVSPVTYPAYRTTSIVARSMVDVLEGFRRGPELAGDPIDSAWKTDLDRRARELEVARSI